MAFALQISQNHGLQHVAPLRSHLAAASATIAMPFPAHWPSLFCLISPEACLLTDVADIMFNMLIGILSSVKNHKL